MVSNLSTIKGDTMKVAFQRIVTKIKNLSKKLTGLKWLWSTKKGVAILCAGLATLLLLVCGAVFYSTNTNEKTEDTLISVQFESAGGNTIAPQMLEDGAKIKRPADPVKDGFIFVEWQSDGKPFDFNSTVKNKVILVAIWKDDGVSKKYTVTFDGAGGLLSVPSIMVKEGLAISRPVDPTKSGYAFTGWYIGDALWGFDNVISKDMTLVAHWVRSAVTSSSSNGGGTHNTITTNNPTTPTNNNSGNGSSTGNTEIIDNDIDTPSGVTVKYDNKNGHDSILYRVTGEVSGTGYQLFRSTTEGGTYTKIDDAGIVSIYVGAQHYVEGYDKSQPYYYKVRAYKNVEGVNYYGKDLSVATYVPAAITSAPSNVMFSVDSYEAELSFNGVANATVYNIQNTRDGDLGAGYSELATTTIGNYSFNAGSPNPDTRRWFYGPMDNYYRVCPENNAADGSYEIVGPCTTDIRVPGIIPGPGLAYDNNTMTLTITDSSNADEYWIYRSTDSFFSDEDELIQKSTSKVANIGFIWDHQYLLVVAHKSGANYDVVSGYRYVRTDVY